MPDRSDTFANCLEGLASALERAGAPAEAASRLLELASVATLKAVALEHAFAPPPRQARPEAPAEAPAVERRAA